RALVVHGAGTDELTCASENVVITVERGRVEQRVVSAADVGLDSSPLDAVRGGTPSENADTLRATLEGKPGAVTDCVLFNAGAAFVAAGRTQTIADGVEQARSVIDAGEALAALERLVSLCAAL